jgi:UDP-2,4-diacetamido-2,4,6-trideoxy-beta-L-altropyranose hydrolase
MTVALRADASAEIGFGHLKRCLSLAHALRAAGAQPVLVVRDLGADAAARVRDEGFDAIRLPEPDAPAPVGGRPPYDRWAGVPEALDAAQTADALRGLKPARVIVDQYAFGADWHRAVAAASGAPVAAIDDLADRRLDVDVVVDPNFSDDAAAKWAAYVPCGADVLAGPAHALLGPAYADGPRWRPSTVVRSIGVFLGGTDAAGRSVDALHAIAATGFDGEVEVVSTRANPALDALRAAIAARPRTRLTLEAPDLAAFFARHDLQIGAGGGATWERCCVGAPTLALLVADNQRPVLHPLERLGAVRFVDATGPGRTDAIADALRPLLHDAALRASLSAAGRRLVDGLGAARVARRLLAP